MNSDYKIVSRNSSNSSNPSNSRKGIKKLSKNVFGYLLQYVVYSEYLTFMSVDRYFHERTQNYIKTQVTLYYLILI